MKYYLLSLVILAVVVIVATCMGPIPVSEEKTWICASCGSRKGQTDVLILWTKSSFYRASPLEQWLAAHDVGHAHDWRWLCGTEKDGSGRVFCCAHRPAPPIYDLPWSCLDHAIHRMSAQDIRRMVCVLESGSIKEQEEVIRQVCEEELRSLAESP